MPDIVPTPALADRAARYKGLIPLPAIASTACTVIGVGTIGRAVALQLAQMGIPTIQLIDYDTVEPHNFGPQGYAPHQLNRPKVEATAANCSLLNPECSVTALNQRYTSSIQTHPFVFVCVDSIEVRQFIWESLGHFKLLIDARMAAESMRILTVSILQKGSGKAYSNTFFPESEGYSAPSCSARSTPYCGNIAASLMVLQMTKFLRDHPIVPDFYFSLHALDLFPATT